MNREQLTKMAECEHRSRTGGNDYLLCNDCGLMWDYRRQSADQGLIQLLLEQAGDATPPAPPAEPIQRPPAGWPQGLCRDVWNQLQDHGLTIGEADDVVSVIAPILLAHPPALGDEGARLREALGALLDAIDTEGIGAHLDTVVRGSYTEARAAWRETLRGTTSTPGAT